MSDGANANQKGSGEGGAHLNEPLLQVPLCPPTSPQTLALLFEADVARSHRSLRGSAPPCETKRKRKKEAKREVIMEANKVHTIDAVGLKRNFADESFHLAPGDIVRRFRKDLCVLWLALLI